MTSRKEITANQLRAIKIMHDMKKFDGSPFYQKVVILLKSADLSKSVFIDSDLLDYISAIKG